MRRDIICLKCYNEIKNFPKFNGEYRKFIIGKAKNDYLCDTCGNQKKIYKGDTCVAYSLYTVRTPYYSWEDEYIERNNICPECGEERPDDDRVKQGMKCNHCAY